MHSRLRTSAFVIAVFAAAPVAAQGTTIFCDVRVFDGTRMIDAQDVLVESGRIAKLGRELAAPAGAVTIDGCGKTLLPGLIDAHTHSGGEALRTALMFGVTTELDTFTDAKSAHTVRTEQKDGKANERADLFSAGTLVTAPKGHGTEYGMPIPTIASPSRHRPLWTRASRRGRTTSRSCTTTGMYGLSLPTLDKPTLRTVIEAAHRRGKLAVVHIGDLASAREAIEAGADGLVYLFVDKDPDAGFGKFVADHRAFVTPTLTVLMIITGTGGGAPLATDPRVLPFLTRMDRTTLTQGFPPRAARSSRWPVRPCPRCGKRFAATAGRWITRSRKPARSWRQPGSTSSLPSS